MITKSAPAIHLDTSFLIGALVPGSVQAESLLAWLRARRRLSISALVWGELLCGPIDGEAVELAARLVGEPIPLTTEEATVGAELYRATGRRRGSLADCLIAASAIVAGAGLATADRGFGHFVSEGLRLVE